MTIANRNNRLFRHEDGRLVDATESSGLAWRRGVGGPRDGPGRNADARRFVLEQNEEAVVALREAVRLSPSMATVYDYLGQALLAVGDPAAAVTEPKHAGTLKPGDTMAGFHLAQTLVAADQSAEAKQILQSIVDSGNAPQEADERFRTLAATPEDVRSTDEKSDESSRR